MLDVYTPPRRDTGPVAPDYTVDQRWSAYSREEHARWDALAARQATLLPGRASAAYCAALDRLPLTWGGIPDLERLSDRLESLTGWRVVAVPELVPDDIFFEHLANRRFPAGAFIRSAEEFDYIEEPDIFHDVFGHVPMLADPIFADFVQAYGAAGQQALSLGALPALARLYWYTVEFGLVREKGELRIFGAGILSSPRETVFALKDASPNRICFDPDRVMRTAYRIDDFQQTYFVIDRFDDLLDLFDRNLSPIFSAAMAQPVIAPDAVLFEDRVIHTGRQAHFAKKKKA
jgi:phenylalanine-4-hydroxylase